MSFEFTHNDLHTTQRRFQILFKILKISKRIDCSRHRCTVVRPSKQKRSERPHNTRCVRAAASASHRAADDRASASILSRSTLASSSARDASDVSRSRRDASLVILNSSSLPRTRRIPSSSYSTWPFSFSVRGIHGLLPMLPGGSTADSCVGFSRLDILCDKSRPYDSDIDDTGTLIFSMLIAIGKPAIMVITFLLHTNFNVS